MPLTYLPEQDPAVADALRQELARERDSVELIASENVVTPQFAELSREHNDANVVTLSGRFVDEETNRAILDAFLATPFGEGRHAGRVEKIMALEAK